MNGMDGHRPGLRPGQVQDRLAEALRRLEELDKNDVTYEAKKMVGESRLSNLRQAVGGDLDEWNLNQREREEDLRMAQEANLFLPDAERPQRPHSSHETTRLPIGHAPYAGSSVNAFGGHFASDGIMAGQGRPAHAASWDMSGENTTTLNTPSQLYSTGRPSSASASSIDSVPFPRKRPIHSLSISSDSSQHVSKAHCPTLPSPGQSTLGTPSSRDSIEATEDISEDLFRLFGGNPNEVTREFEIAKREQEDHMKAMEARRQQERADEEFARSLQDELNGQDPPEMRTSAGPSFPNSNQTYLNSNGQVHRPTPASSSPVPIFDDPFALTPSSSKPAPDVSIPPGWSRTKNGTPYPNALTKAPVHHEQLHRPSLPGPSTRRHDDFITIDDDDGGDEEFLDFLNNRSNGSTTHPNSDLVEVDSRSWLQSHHNVVPGAFPPEPLTNPVSSSTNNGLGNWGSITGTARRYADSMYDVIGQTMSSLEGGNSIGRMSGYGGRHSTMGYGRPIIDLDQEDYGPQSFYQRSMARAGLDPANMGLVDIYRQRYDYISHDPTRTAREMKELLENIRPDEDLPPQDREGTPAAMVYPLMEHQKLGVAWMRRMEEGSNHGGSKSPKYSV